MAFGELAGRIPVFGRFFGGGNGVSKDAATVQQRKPELQHGYPPLVQTLMQIGCKLTKEVKEENPDVPFDFSIYYREERNDVAACAVWGDPNVTMQTSIILKSNPVSGNTVECTDPELGLKKGWQLKGYDGKMSVTQLAELARGQAKPIELIPIDLSSYKRQEIDWQSMQ